MVMVNMRALEELALVGQRDEQPAKDFVVLE
jgi:hypothetical protein